MSNKQTTAVQWLIEQTRTPEWHSLKRGDIIEQAKVIERKQIEDAINKMPTEIFVTYDRRDGEVLCAFTNEEVCKNEAIDGGCGMQKTRLVVDENYATDYFTSTFITE